MFFHRQTKNNISPRLFIEHEEALGFLSKHDRVLGETSSLGPEGIADWGNPLGLSILSSRFRWAVIFLLAIFFIFVSRTAYLQVIRGAEYRIIAEENRFQIRFTPAERGIVMDRRNTTLIENTPVFSLIMTIADLPKSGEQRGAVFERTADLVGLQRTDLDLLLQEYSDALMEEVVVKKELGYEQAILVMIELPDLPGFAIRSSTKRRYNTAAVSLSHVLGYVGKISAEEFTAKKDSGYRRVDEIGKTGIEASWETALRGRPGKKLVEMDALGKETKIFSEEKSVKGSALMLSLDAKLQKAVERYLDEAIAKIGRRRASAVVMDPNNGEVLALVSLPTYDSNAFAGGIDPEIYYQLSENPNQPLFPRALAGEFPSGSTFKPYVAAAALAEGVISPSTSFFSVGGLTIGQWFFPDWKSGGHGLTDVRKAIAESVNTFFYIIGGGYDTLTGLGVDRITSYARLFGFGAVTGVDLPSETDGFLPSKQWKEEVKDERWYVGDTYHLAIGQGDLLVTPIQMAAALSTIANGGIKYVPRVVRAVDGQLIAAEGAALPDPLREAIKVVQQGMRQTVASGSARQLNSLPIAAAGKTGTAQIGGSEETHAWFTGFAPYENPEIAVVVLIEEGGEGTAVAVPVAEKIFYWWYLNRDMIY